MKDLLLHNTTRQAVEAFLAEPSHALLLVGPSGSGKRTLAVKMTESLLGLPAGSLTAHPYAHHISPEDGKAIGIEAVRQLEKFLALKVPGSQKHDRAVIIEDAHLLSVEAQNALLKTLEEPPEGTILILTVNALQAVLPTIHSRGQAITINKLEKSALERHFASLGADETAITQAYAISGGMPGLMTALLHEEAHPLLAATSKARQLLSQSSYERLLTVDQLSKQRALAIDVTSILQQMAHVSLQSADGTAARKWETIMQASYEASEALHNSAQPKLALTKLMLTL